MSPRVSVLTERDCIKLLNTKSVGRLAFIVDGRPEIFPVTYAFEDRVVVFRTSSGMKLERGPYAHAAFEVDDIDGGSGVAWSVVVHGTAQDISSSIDALSERLRKIVISPAAPGRRTSWMAIYADRITGRRFTLPAR